MGSMWVSIVKVVLIALLIVVMIVAGREMDRVLWEDDDYGN